MTVEEYTLIRISSSNKEKLDNYKVIERESYNSVLDDLIRFGDEKGFNKDLRIKNLTKNLKKEENANIKIKQEAIRATTAQ